MRLKAFLKDHLHEIILFFLFTSYFSYFIYKTTFTIHGKVYFRLFDDAMIFMSYAKNLVNGYGLNWAKFGPPVEGFTSPLWVFFMIPINLLPIALNLKPLVFQSVCFGFLVLNLIFVKKLLVAHYTDKKYVIFSTLFLTAFYYPLNHWSVQGMESPMQALLVTAGIYYLFNTLFLDQDTSVLDRDLIKLSIVLCLSLLLRLDMIFFVLILLSVLLYKFLRHTAYFSRRAILTFLAILILPNLGYELFRILYFGDILPNTYYLKMANTPLVPRLLRGWYVVSNYLSLFSPVLIVLTVYAIFKRNIKVVLPIVIFLVYCGYSVYVGGDAWEDTFIGNRFVNFTAPLVFLVFAHLINEIKIKKKIIYYVFVIPLMPFVFLSFNGLLPWIDSYKHNWRLVTLLKAPKPGVAQDKYMFMSQKLNEILDPDAVILFGSAGVSGYYSNNKLADALGYNNKVIAKGEIVRKITKDNYKIFYPGHLKLNYPYVFDQIKPDLIVEVQFFDEPAIKEEFLKLAEYNGYKEIYGFWYKESSPYINFDRIEELKEFGTP